MKSLAKILEHKDHIISCCKVFNYDNPKILYLGTDRCFNLVVDDIDATYDADVLLENLLSDKLECSVNVVILQEIPEHLKAIHNNNMADLDDRKKIELIFKKAYTEINVKDRNLDKVRLVQYEEDLKIPIIEAFKSKGKSSPYSLPESESVERIDPKESVDGTKSRKREKPIARFFEGKSEKDSSTSKVKRHKSIAVNEGVSFKSHKPTKRS